MTPSAVDRSDTLRALVEYLCSPVCAGRAPGTPEGRAARARIVEELRALELEPLGDDGFLQSVPGCQGANVLARLPGSGPRADRAVLVAAHYDHLGRLARLRSESDLRWPPTAYWGADDNAAAVAVLVDVARQLTSDRRSLGRQVLFAAFDGEEPPYFLTRGMGSMHFAAHPPIPLERIDMMLCMDLVGHALGGPNLPAAVRGSLFVLGAEASAGTSEIVDVASRRAEGLFPRRMSIDVIPPLSDYYAFQAERVPILFLTGGRWQHYHQVTDTPDRLDYPKMVATSTYLAGLIRAFADGDRPSPVFLGEGRDDRASLETVEALGKLLLPYTPDLARGAPVLERLRDRLSPRGTLDASAWGLLAGLVGALENAIE